MTNKTIRATKATTKIAHNKPFTAFGVHFFIARVSNTSIPIAITNKVTYKIVLKNDSRFSTDVRIKDILPKEYTDLNINSDIEHESKSGNSSSGDWITVPANDEVEYTVTLIDLSPLQDKPIAIPQIKVVYMAGQTMFVSEINILINNLFDM